jgi:hypothetical protein
MQEVICVLYRVETVKITNASEEHAASFFKVDPANSTTNTNRRENLKLQILSYLLIQLVS